MGLGGDDLIFVGTGQAQVFGNSGTDIVIFSTAILERYLEALKMIDNRQVWLIISELWSCWQRRR